MVTTAPVPRDHIVATEFDGGEGVLVNLNSKQYYQLNETAMFVWRCLEEGHSLSEIINKMTAAYDVTPEQAAESVDKVLSDFQSRGLVQPSS